MIRLVAALVGAVPVIASAIMGRLALLFTTTVAALSGTLGSAIVTNVTGSVSQEMMQAVVAIDAAAGVTVTLTCAIYLGIHQTAVGFLRILWLITFVTSSCSYAYFQKLAPGISIVPNDVTVVAIGVAVGLLLASILTSRACFTESYPQIRDSRSILVELIFVSGALTLRFDEDLSNLVGVEVGWAAWYVSMWSAALLTLYIRFANEES